jgi:hypothetical protein
VLAVAPLPRPESSHASVFWRRVCVRAVVDMLKADDPPSLPMLPRCPLPPAGSLEVHAAGLLVFARQPGGHEA